MPFLLPILPHFLLSILLFFPPSYSHTNFPFSRTLSFLPILLRHSHFSAVLLTKYGMMERNTISIHPSTYLSPFHTSPVLASLSPSSAFHFSPFLASSHVSLYRSFSLTFRNFPACPHLPPSSPPLIRLWSPFRPLPASHLNLRPFLPSSLF